MSEGKPPEVANGGTPIARARLISARELSTWLGISEAGLSQMRFRNEGPPYFKFGRTVRYAEDAVQAWIDQNKREPR